MLKSKKCNLLSISVLILAALLLYPLAGCKSNTGSADKTTASLTDKNTEDNTEVKMSEGESSEASTTAAETTAVEKMEPINPPISAKKIMFLGDSLSEDGTYIMDIIAYLYRNLDPEAMPEVINLGVASETVSGLSEPDHPFHRPCVRGRIDKALELVKPDWVIIEYGANDGIFYPFSDERFNEYKTGMTEVVTKIKASGAHVVVLTPPVIDVASIEGKVLPEGAEKYSYKEPYAEYDAVMERYGSWVMSELAAMADVTVDIHTPLKEYISGQRQSNTEYKYGDGIHPDKGGYWVMAKTILSSLYGIAPDYKPDYLTHREFFSLVRQQFMVLSPAWREYIGHDNPNKSKALAIDEAVKKAAEFTPQIREALKE